MPGWRLYFVGYAGTPTSSLKESESGLMNIQATAMF